MVFLLLAFFGQIHLQFSLKTVFIGIMKHVTYIRLEKKQPKLLDDKIDKPDRNWTCS